MDTSILKSAQVGEVMQREFDVVAPDLPLREAAGMIRRRRGRAMVVEASDASPSIITEFDIVKAVDDIGDLDKVTVGERLTRVAVAGEPEWTLSHAVDTMLQAGFRHLIVIESGDVVGMLSMRDVVRRLTDESFHAEPDQDTVDLGAHVPADTTRAIHLHRRSAKQHWSSIKCPCQLDWLEVIIGQAELRSDLTIDEIDALWEQRQPCPVLQAKGGAGD